ncbi:hypothetical protein FRAAL3264 [Frankia alni ACN14a]|uniref:Uncharacterized protein n=1 Tax=Frankia alni (strain DSM 45986 / CECT 9034 / ACN14a) TaxID=326424 RepID=Q0RKP7_FRAAA|nr:hypothetical protein FRAAL3264 [Frankia alni ACN14a]
MTSAIRARLASCGDGSAAVCPADEDDAGDMDDGDMDAGDEDDGDEDMAASRPDFLRYESVSNAGG